MPQRFATFQSRVDGNLNSLEDVPLTDHLVHAFWTQCGIFFIALQRGLRVSIVVVKLILKIVVVRIMNNCFSWHGNGCRELGVILNNRIIIPY